MTIKVYTAAQIGWMFNYADRLPDSHITLSFMNPAQCGFSFNQVKRFLNTIHVVVERVEYWEQANVTVAIIEDNERLNALMGVMRDQGHTYELDWKPHVTLGKGDLVDKYDFVVGAKGVVYNIYLKIKDFPPPRFNNFEG